jgi:hypothetical protein
VTPRGHLHEYVSKSRRVRVELTYAIRVDACGVAGVLEHADDCITFWLKAEASTAVSFACHDRAERTRAGFLFDADADSRATRPLRAAPLAEVAGASGGRHL